MITLIPYIVAVLGAILALSLPKGRDLSVAIFLIPFAAFVIDFGVSLTTHEFVIFILVLKYIFLGPIKLNHFIAAPIFLSFFALCLLGAFLTLNYGPDVPGFAGGSPMRNGWGRVLSVMLNFGISFSLVLLILSARNYINPKKMLETYIFACITLALLGLFQLAFFTATGVDIFPIGIFQGTENSRSGISIIQGSGQILRVSSFGGEPKGLGQSLTVAVMILFLFRRQFGWNSQKYWSVMILLFGIILATTSTSAFIMILTVAGVLLVFSIFRQDAFKSNELKFIFTGISTLISTLYWGIAVMRDNLTPVIYKPAKTYGDYIRSRTIDRIRLDDTDSVIWESIATDYWGLFMGRGLGLAHHYAYNILPPHMERYMGGRIIPAKSGMSYYVGNGGLIGLLLITLFAACLVPSINSRYGKVSANKADLIKKFQALCVGLWAAHLLRLYTFDITWTIFAIAAVLGYQITRPTNLQKMPRK